MKKLTESDIEKIKALRAKGETNAAIAHQFGVHSTTIGKLFARPGTYGVGKNSAAPVAIDIPVVNQSGGKVAVLISDAATIKELIGDLWG